MNKEITLQELRVVRKFIESHLSKDDIQAAIKTLLSFCNKSTYNEFLGETIIQSASLVRINKAYRQGQIDWERMSQKKNMVIANILAIIKNLENEVHDSLETEIEKLVEVRLEVIVLEAEVEVEAEAAPEVEVELLPEVELEIILAEESFVSQQDIFKDLLDIIS